MARTGARVMVVVMVHTRPYVHDSKNAALTHATTASDNHNPRRRSEACNFHRCLI